jgi:hypothetical protein
MGTSKLRSAVGKLSVPAVSTGLRNMFKSKRDFMEASEMESLLTGRQPSMVTGLPSRFREQSRRTVQPSIIEENKETIVPDPNEMGGGRTRRKGFKNRSMRMRMKMSMRKHRRAYTRKHRTSYKKRSSHIRRR